MIYLITGTPGAGKTLYAVSTLVQQLCSQEIEQDGKKVKRRLVADNVNGLLLPHELMAPGTFVQGEVQPGDGDGLWNWPSWCKPGDVIFVDEVQRHWRPRGMSTKVKPEVAALETHRHMGVDFVIVTQSPMLLDQNVRRLVGRHQHVRRMLGMHRAVIYDWDGCSQTLSPKSATGTSYFSYPKKAFELYKSSELHTKQKQKIPLWVVVPILAVLGGVFILPKAFGVMSGAMTGKGVTSSVGAPAPVGPASTPAVLIAAPVAGSSAPAAQSLVSGYLAPVVAPAVPVGCIVVQDRCGCFDAQGKKVPAEPAACFESAGVNGVPKAVIEADPVPHVYSAAELDTVAFSFKR